MSMNIGQLFLELGADSARLTPQVVAAAKQAGDQASASLGQRLTQGMTKAGQSLTRTGSAMMQGITLPIVAAGTAVTKFALDFDTTMRQVQGLAKVPASEIAGIKTQILALGAETGRTPNDLAQAFYFVASAGFKADEAMKVLEISAKAAASGMGQTQDIAKVLGAVLNAYGHENITAAHAADVLTAAVQDGSAEASDFATALGNVVPTASQMGVSFDQVTAAMAAMTNVGIDAQTAAVNLNQIFSSLIKPTSQADTALESVGLSAAGLRQELKDKGLLATLRTLQGAFEGNDTAIAAVFGNIRALRGVNALLAQDESALTGIFKDTATAVGNLGDAYAASDGPQRAFDKAIASLQGSAIELGSIILPGVAAGIVQLASGVKSVADVFTSLPKPIQETSISPAGHRRSLRRARLHSGQGRRTAFGALGKAILFLTGTGPGSLGALIAKIPLVGVALSKVLGPLGLVIAGDDGSQDGPGRDRQADLPRQATRRHQGLRRRRGGLHCRTERHHPHALRRDGRQPLAGRGHPAHRTGERVDVGRGHQALPADQLGHLFDPVAGRAWPDIAHGYAAILAGGLKDGAGTVDAAAKVTVNGIPWETRKAVAEAAAAAGQAPKDIAAAMLANLGDLNTALKALHDEIVGSVSDVKTRAGIEAALASKTVRDGLRSSNTKTRLDTITFVQGLITQYNLLAPGALRAGELVNPALAKALKANLILTDDAAQQIAAIIGVDLQTGDVAYAAGQDVTAQYRAGVLLHKSKVKQAGKDLANDALTEMQIPHQALSAGADAGLSFGQGIHSPKNTTNAHQAGAALAQAAQSGWSAQPWGAWGQASAKAYIDGWYTYLVTKGKARLATGLHQATAPLLQGNSPPREGPLHLIDRWGANVGKAWVGPFVGQIGQAAGMLKRPLGSLGDTLSAALAAGFPTPSYAGVPAGMPMGTGGGTNNFNLHVMGDARVNDGFDAARRLAGMGLISSRDLSGVS